MTNQIVFGEVVNPLTDRKYSRIGNDRFTYRLKSVVNGRIKLPYDGIIVSTNHQNVSGYLLAKHKINGEDYYSEYTNIPRLIVTAGDVLSKGQIIGYFQNNTDEITYLLRNSRMYRVPSEPFFNPINDNTNDDDDKGGKNKRKERDDEDKEDNIKRKTTSDFLLLKPMQMSLNKGGDISDKIKKSFSDAISDTFSIKKKKKSETDDNIPTVNENKKLYEQVQRIKKLL